MTTEFAPYRDLLRRAREIALVTSSASVLGWDQETYLPAQSVPYRAEQLSFLGGWAHRMFTAPEVGDWISACEQQDFAPLSREGANLREWRRQYDRQTRLPAELVEQFRRTTSLAREAWLEARRRSEFALFRPHLERILDLCRRMADCWGYEKSRYDALLEEYEPGARTDSLAALFTALQPAMTILVAPAVARSEAIPEDLLAGEYPIPNQQAFNREVAAALGFDFASGRIDTTAHPFCAGLGPRDCRLTTRYDETNFTQSLYGILHEAGHGLYELGLRVEDYGTPVGTAASLGIHESQSRLWENHVGRTLRFWTHWHPVACRHFPSLRRLSPDQIAAAVSRVAPSLIRVEADPVTYDLHILLRFEVERMLVESQVAVTDVPALWNERFEKLIGLKVPDDTRGCLQDIHWSLGTFGYFPTYTLGNLNAAQLFRAAHRAHPGLDAELSHGHYATLLAWLRSHVHEPGQQFLPQELIRRATGDTTQPGDHLEYLRRQFAGISCAD
jgi:carboxypeptidase Taq